MIIKILALTLGVIALIMTFKSGFILENIFKVEEPSQKMILKVKYVALAVAVVAFLLVFITK